MTQSLRRFIRIAKARIRRGVLSLQGQQEAINELYKKHHLVKGNDNSGDIQSGNK